jgi:hypothetical protein
MLWLQLINEKHSRLGESHMFKELLRQDHVRFLVPIQHVLS